MKRNYLPEKLIYFIAGVLTGPGGEAIVQEIIESGAPVLSVVHGDSKKVSFL